MGTKLVRIAEISATSKHPIFTSVYHLINEDMLKQCHKELDGNKAVGIDKVTKDEYGKNLDRNIKELVQRLKNKSFKSLPSLRVYIPKGNGKKRPLGIASYEDKIVQMAVKKIRVPPTSVATAAHSTKAPSSRNGTARASTKPAKSS